jgi:hypothetical protein
MMTPAHLFGLETIDLVLRGNSGFRSRAKQALHGLPRWNWRQRRCLRAHCERRSAGNQSKRES